MSEDRIFGVEDEVLVLRLYKGDESCSEYGFKLESKSADDSPIHLEQLNVLDSILSKHVERAQNALLHSTITNARAARISAARVKDNLLKFPDPPPGKPS